MENKKNIKLCKKCNSEISINAKKCPICKEYQQIPVWAMVVVVVIVIIIVSQLASAFMFVKNDVKENINDNSNISNNNTTNSFQNNNYNNDVIESTKKVYGYNETFVFDDLEITIGDNYTFDVVKNRYSDYNNQTAVKLPITVKNISNDTHGLNMFYYDIYGTNGVEVENFSAYFDNNIEYAGDLRSGASYTKYLYFQYDGDGTYAIEFDNYSTEVDVEINITK